DPALRLVDLAGRLRVVGDSLEVDLSRVRFPRSQLRTARGRVSWPHDTLLFDLSLHADSATLSDFHFIDRRFAPGAVLAGGGRLRAHGGRGVGGGAGGDLRFQPFTVKAVVDLGTVERLVPAAALHGLLYADGTLNGPLRDVQFTGTLEHRDGARPPTRLTGTVRLDGRSDTLGVYADLTADSLSFDGLKGSFPALPLRGAVAGRVQVAGPLAALETHAELHSAGGAVQGDGVLLLGGKGARTGARDFTLHARDLDLARWLDRGPASLLTFSVEGSVVADGALPPVG